MYRGLFSSLNTALVKHHVSETNHEVAASAVSKRSPLSVMGAVGVGRANCREPC